MFKAAIMWLSKLKLKWQDLRNSLKTSLTEPHRTVIARSQIEQNQIHQLSIALEQQLLKELRENPNEKTV